MESITEKILRLQSAIGTLRIGNGAIGQEIGAIVAKEAKGEAEVIGETEETEETEVTGEIEGEGTEGSEAADEEVVVIGETGMGVEIETVTPSPRRRKYTWIRQQDRPPRTSRSASRKYYKRRKVGIPLCRTLHTSGSRKSGRRVGKL
jgi:hypothetical protein